MKKFFLNLQFIFKPSYWLMNNRYSKRMDELMITLLNKYEFTEIGEHTANLGDTTIWIGNIPHSCMMPYFRDLSYNKNERPSRLTIQMGIRKLELQEKAKENEKLNKKEKMIQELINKHKN